MLNIVGGIYLIAVAIALILWMSGPLYVVPTFVWVVVLVMQAAIGGIIISRSRMCQ